MRLVYLFFLILSAAQAKQITKGARATPAYTPTEFLEEIYMGEPFLTQQLSLSDLWFQVTGKITYNVWQGFL